MAPARRPADTARLLAWQLAAPLRRYVTALRRLPGKGFIVQNVLRRLLPREPAEFEVVMRAGGRFCLRYREVIGFSVFLRQTFEDAEIRVLMRETRPGTVAIDVGAHVGLLTIPLARKLAEAGRVWAFEPLTENADRLERHVAVNGVANVSVRRHAVGARDGEAVLHAANDSAYASLGAVLEGRATGGQLRVPCLSLDTVWLQEGSPDVSVIKVDVEGGEVDVLHGAAELIRTCRPFVLLEVNDQERLAHIREWFLDRDYQAVTDGGLLPRNHAFTPTAPV